MFSENCSVFEMSFKLSVLRFFAKLGLVYGFLSSAGKENIIPLSSIPVTYAL
jgi:hypothetical protein